MAFSQAQPDLVVFDDHPGQHTPLPHQTASPSSPAPCARTRAAAVASTAAASTRQVVLGRQPVRQQNNTKGSRTPAPRAPLGSPPAADTRPGVLQQMRAVRGAGAALPRCPGPRSADLKRAPSNFSKSGRDGRRGAAAQHTHYGAVHRDAGQPRAMRASSAPPGACSARSRAAHALSSRFSPILFIFGRQTRIFPPKKKLKQIIIQTSRSRCHA